MAARHATREWIEVKPKPFTWTKTVEDIIARERRALNALDEIRGNREQASDS